jgi:hypothetical protein
MRNLYEMNAILQDQRGFVQIQCRSYQDRYNLSALNKVVEFILSPIVAR